MRAVLARRAALLALLTGLFAFDLLVVFAWLVVFADVLLAGVGFFAGVFTAFLGAVVAKRSGAVAELPDDCPATGDTIISAESRAAKQREAGRGTNVGEDGTFISSL
ncbi:MAG: hypothetical protein ABR907_14600 [Terracidiphilus sp.]|jgi:hypothetical protein